MQQLLLDVTPSKKKYLAEDFLPLSSSFSAHRLAISSLCSDFSGCVIFGPVATGKTHLLNVCAQYLSPNKDKMVYISNINDLPKINNDIHYLLIDNITKLNLEQQEQLFHWFNHINQVKGKMLLVFNKPLEQIVQLADLKSRLLTLQQAILEQPNEKDLEIFILKLAFDRQVEISPDVLSYLLLRVERNFKFIENLIDLIDQESLREKRKITVPFIKEFLK